MLRFLAFCRIFMTAEGSSSAMHKYFSHAQPDNNAPGIYDKCPAPLPILDHRPLPVRASGGSGGFLSCLCVIFSRTIRRPHNVNRLPLKRVQPRSGNMATKGCPARQMLLLRFRLSAGSPWQRTTDYPAHPALCAPSVRGGHHCRH